MAHVSDEQVRFLQEKANEIRQTIIEMLVEAGSGHTAGPLGMSDIFAALYFHVLKHNPSEPLWDERDRLILSNGHIAPVLYATLAHAGYFPLSETRTLRAFGSRLQGHPERGALPGVETTSGPLGLGLSQAAGIAYSARMDGRDIRVYALLSDGELQSGNTWEALMFAGANRLGNLMAIVDRNNIQIGGRTEDVMPLEPLREKFVAFNWNTLEVNGHNVDEFISAVEASKAAHERPTIIIAHTIPGKGIQSIENDYLWHGKPPTREEGERFLTELRALTHQNTP
jgi:transketolase